jgi:16S rRNA G527 N7-methylase RsmG
MGMGGGKGLSGIYLKRPGIWGNIYKIYVTFQLAEANEKKIAFADL